MLNEKTMHKHASADVVIFGGGIAGLWLLNRLRQTGLSVILFETGALGGGQTNKAQGIIHGGMKYALQGVLTNEAQAMADVPAIWKQCLQGTGEINLINVQILSKTHYLWAPSKLTSMLGGFLAGAALTSKVSSLDKAAYPVVFQNDKFKGDVFALDELVVDVPSLVRELVKPNQDVVFKIEPLTEKSIQLDDDGNIDTVTVSMLGNAVAVKAQQFIFTAGAGNELMVKKLKSPQMDAQRRPLHMVLVKTPFDFPIYAHCLGLGPRPRITITTHYLHSGETVWYLGGALAEDGVRRNRNDQIKAAQHELQTLFPWLDFSGAQFSTFMVDRAEPKQKSGLKPESTYSQTLGNVTIAWPTKLALAPKLSAEILQQLQKLAIGHYGHDIHELRAWPMPPLATPVWEDAFCKNVA